MQPKIMNNSEVIRSKGQFLLRSLRGEIIGQSRTTNRLGDRQHRVDSSDAGYLRSCSQVAELLFKAVGVSNAICGINNQLATVPTCKTVHVNLHSSQTKDCSHQHKL